MKIALYTADHAGDSFAVRVGWRITQAVQKGQFSKVTHCEAIHDEYDDGSVQIVSSSLREGGVRSKRVKLDPKSWMIVNVPLWDVEKSKELYVRTVGQGYDLRGAIATVFLGSPERGRWFCNQWVSEPFLQAPATFGPHQFAAISLSLGRDVTDAFFRDRA